MVVAFEGWNDAGDAASRAVEHLQLNWDATPLAELEPDDYYDFQVSRPTVRMVDGVTRRVDWPTTTLSVGCERKRFACTYRYTKRAIPRARPPAAA